MDRPTKPGVVHCPLGKHKFDRQTGRCETCEMVSGSSWHLAQIKATGHRGYRFEKLENLERRCNGDSHCTRTAQVEFELLAINPNTNEPLTGVEEVKRSCTRHRVKYEGGPQWKILKTVELGPIG